MTSSLQWFACSSQQGSLPAYVFFSLQTPSLQWAQMYEVHTRVFLCKMQAAHCFCIEDLRPLESAFFCLLYGTGFFNSDGMTTCWDSSLRAPHKTSTNFIINIALYLIFSEYAFKKSFMSVTAWPTMLVSILNQQLVSAKTSPGWVYADRDGCGHQFLCGICNT